MKEEATVVVLLKVEEKKETVVVVVVVGIMYIRFPSLAINKYIYIIYRWKSIMFNPSRSVTLPGI